MQTKAQQDLILAERLVSVVDARNQEVKRIYGNLCHSFPVMVRTCGLCQAVAFSADKAANDTDRATAHRLLLEHIGTLLGADNNEPLATLRTANAVEYMLHTRRVLAAWIYFKRFAVSILQIEAGDDNGGQV